MLIKMDNQLLLLKQQILECIQQKKKKYLIYFKIFVFSSPNFSFQNFIPTNELPNGAITTLNPAMENSTRRITHRNNKNPNQQTFITTKPSFERANHYTETREKMSNKINRKQRFNTNHHIQQINIQPSSHFINTRSKFFFLQNQRLNFALITSPMSMPVFYLGFFFREGEINLRRGRTLPALTLNKTLACHKQRLHTVWAYLELGFLSL
jgi:hypothetical protein